MLETIREFALERLGTGNEAETARARHAGYRLTLAEAAEPALRGPEQTTWLDRLEEEHDNLRAGLADLGHCGGAARAVWSDQPSIVELGQRMAAALTWFWLIRGYVTEGYRWLNATLADRPPGDGEASDPAVRARALAGRPPGPVPERSRALGYAPGGGDPIVAGAGDHETVAWSLGALGETARLLGNPPGSRVAGGEPDTGPPTRRPLDDVPRPLPSG